MNKRKTFFFISLTMCLLVLFLLVTGSSVLTKAIDPNGKVPAGTLITWIGMISLPSTIYWGVYPLRKPKGSIYTVLSVLIRICIILCILWVPISYLLAGNLSFSFGEKTSFQGGQLAMRWFWRLSYGFVIAPLVVLLAHWPVKLFNIKQIACKN